MGKWDRDEYMNEVNWSEKKLKKGYKIEMCFWYLDEVEENRFMCCCWVVERVKESYDKVIKVDIKWDEQFVECGESDKMEEMLKCFLLNPSTPRKGLWRQDMQEYLRKIE